MAIVVGEIHKGEVTGITNFGAFIKLANGETGLCHISEVSSEYVKDVKSHLKIGQEVEAKVIKVDGGKLSLSIKACEEQIEKKQPEIKREPRSYGEKKNFEKMLSSFIDNGNESVQKPSKGSRRKGNGYNRK
jgi:S1 RNA binding domain protein